MRYEYFIAPWYDRDEALEDLGEYGNSYYRHFRIRDFKTQEEFPGVFEEEQVRKIVEVLNEQWKYIISARSNVYYEEE
jgi:hypothetical protein